MTLDRAVPAFAGFVVLASLALGYFGSPWFLLLNALAGVNMIQACVSGACPAAYVSAAAAGGRPPPMPRLLPALVPLLLGALPAAAADYVVAPLTVDETKAVFGTVAARDTVPARARISGTVHEIRVEAGSKVAAGDVIAVVADDKLVLQEKAADAEMAGLSSQLQNARTELDRLGQLFARAAVPKSQVDDAETKVSVLVGQLDAASARRAVIAEQMTEGDVLAPLSGRVLSVPVTRDSVVIAGDTIVRIAGGGYFLRLALPERHAAAIREGDVVKVGRRVLAAADAAPAQFRDGRLVKIYPEISDGRVLADVEVGDLGDYFVGERTLVLVPIEKRTILAVPAAAVTSRHGIDTVDVAAPGGALEVAVVLGRTLDDGRVEVMSGLKAGDRVVLK
jgi:RND family efflux transporter MFP subunit